MSDVPVFTKVDADRILRRAAEIEGAEDPRPLTLSELRSIAGEAGFGVRALERAIAEAQHAQHAQQAEDRPLPVQRSGLVVARLSTRRTLAVEIGYEQLMRAVRLLQPYREGPAHVKLEEHQLTWRDRKGIQFMVTSGEGTTEIRVLVSKVLIRRGRWIGWVKAAADRLEKLVYLVASLDGPETLGIPAAVEREEPADR